MSLKPKSGRSSVQAQILNAAIFFVGAFYLAVCVRHFLFQRPLWLDENMVFESVKNFAPPDFFTQRLAAGQIFPKLQLFLVQRICEPFSFNLLSVRFLSFAAMMGGFAVWMKIARIELKDKLTFFTYLLSWAGSSFLVYYSAELKPYSMDVLVSGVFVLFLYKADHLQSEKPLFYLLGLAFLPLLGLISYPAFLFYAFLLYHLLTSRIKDAFWLKCFLLFSVAAAVSLAALYFFDIRYTKANASTQGYADHIVSLASISEFLRTWWDGTTDLFCRYFAERPRFFKRLSMPFGLIGFGYMFYSFWKNFRLGGYRFNSFRSIALVLYAELFVLGILQKYPFSVPRTSLFFCPVILFLIVEGIGALQNVNSYLSKIVHFAYILFLAVIAAGIGREALAGPLGFSPLIM